MKAKMSYKSKRLAIIVAIIVALIIAISIGTYYFIKANTEVGAAYENTQGIEENDNGESEVTEPSENQEENQNDENETEISDENNENQTQNGTTEENEGDESVSQEGTSTEGTTTGTSNSELPNEEYTQTEIVEREEERIEEGLTVTWAGLSLANAQISSDIVTSGPNLEINKVAKLNSINENDNAIQKGSKITYEITVANTNTEVVAKNVNISDVIPEGTTLVENSISHNGIEVEDKISWVIPEVTAENPITVSFTVEVVNEKGEIKNTAVVDGKNTPETVNPVIETHKTVSSENSALTELKEGSEIEYSIKVTNTSKEEQAIAKTTVKDIVPEGTTLVEGSITGSENYTVEEVNGQKVITWNDITLNPEESKELKFKVTINAFEGESKEIKNAALVGDTNTNEEKVTVYNPILNIYKSAKPEKVSEGDTITYTITVENDGKVDGLGTIKDSIPTGTTFTNASIQINGETTTKTAGDLEQGIQVNVPAEDSVTLTFKVTVDNNSGLTGNISNTAYLVDEKGNEKTTDPTETKVEAKIVFVENGGTDVADIDGYAGDIIENTTMPTTTKTGYTFDGWYADESFTTKVEQLPSEMTAGTTTYYAKWNINSYTITYKIVGDYFANDSYAQETYNYGEKVTPVAEPSKEGYTFSGWTAIPETMPAKDLVVTGSFTAMPRPSLTLTKTALNTNEKEITELTYYANKDNYMYYRLKVENTVEGSYPEIVTDEQTITDTLPLGMTTEGKLPDGATAKTIYDKDGEKRTQITWKVSNIGYGEKAKQIDIKVKLDEEVFKGKEVDAGTETTVISDIVADYIEDYNEGNSNDKHNTMSMFVRFASPTDGNSGYLYAGTTKAANRNMPSGEAFVPGYNDDIINSNINNEEKLANMLDDFVTANNNGTMSKYTAYGLPTTNTVKRFLENNYGISLTDNQVVLWYKVVDAYGEKSRTRRYEITNKNTGNITYKDIKMSACSYHIDGIIVDVRSLGTLIPDGATVNVINTASVQTTSNMWKNTTSSVSTLIYYNSKIESTQNMSVQTLSVQSTNILSKALSKVETEEINQVNIDEVIEKIEKSEIENEVIEQENNNVTENIVENETIENTVNKQEELDNNLIMDDINKTTEQSNNLLNNESSQENETTVDSSEIFNEDITENVVDENVETEENKIEEIKEENEELNQ